MARLTRRGIALLAAAILLFAAGQWLGYPVLLVVAAIGIGLVLAALLVGTHRPKVTVTREVYPDRVQRGGAAVGRLRVHNPNTRWQAGFSARDRVGTIARQVVVRPLRRGASADYSYELPTDVRGRHIVGPLTLDREDALGLGRGRVTTGATATLWVQPKTWPMRPITAGRLRLHYAGRQTAYSMRGSLDLREVREYVPGDEVRHLHWKATARTGKLMVREYVDPNLPRFTTLLDTRAELMPAEVFEDAVDLTASLVMSAIRADYGCRLLTTCGVDIQTEPAAQRTGRPFLDTLSEISRKPDERPLLPRELAGTMGGGLVLVLAGMSAADRAQVAAARERFSTVIVIVVGASTEPVPGVQTILAGSAAEAVERWNLVVSR